MDIADKGLYIEYNIIDQNMEGTTRYRSVIKIKTYTVYISNLNEWIWSQSFDDLETGLICAVKEAKKLLDVVK